MFKSILIVEDEETLRESVKRIFIFGAPSLEYRRLVFSKSNQSVSSAD